MSSPNYDYLDGNAAAGELSKILPSISRLQRDGAPSVAPPNAWLKHAYTCMAQVLSRDALPASTYFFVW